MNNKSLDVNNNLDKSNGKGGQIISVSEFSIKDDGEIISVISFKRDK